MTPLASPRMDPVATRARLLEASRDPDSGPNYAGDSRLRSDKGPDGGDPHRPEFFAIVNVETGDVDKRISVKYDTPLRDEHAVSRARSRAHKRAETRKMHAHPVAVRPLGHHVEEPDAVDRGVGVATDGAGTWGFAESATEDGGDEHYHGFAVGDRVLVCRKSWQSPRIGEIIEIQPGAMDPDTIVVDYDGPGQGHVTSGVLKHVDELQEPWQSPDTSPTYEDVMRFQHRLDATHQQVRRLHAKMDVLASRLGVGGVDEVGCPECGEVGQPERVLGTPCPHEDVPWRADR